MPLLFCAVLCLLDRYLLVGAFFAGAFLAAAFFGAALALAAAFGAAFTFGAAAFFAGAFLAGAFLAAGVTFFSICLARFSRSFSYLEIDRPLPRLASPAGERRLTLRLPVQVSSLYMSWNVPTLATHPDDFYALTMLSAVFDGGMSARLETNLVRGSELAAGAGAGYGGISRADGLFTVTATPKNGVTLANLESAVQQQLDQLRQNPPSEEEMRRVRAGVLSSQVYGRDSLFGQAMELGQLVTLGVDWRLADEFIERLNKVTPEDVQRVAARWLVNERLAVAHVLPEEAK